jgi:hypothetical protein
MPLELDKWRIREMVKKEQTTQGEPAGTLDAKSAETLDAKPAERLDVNSQALIAALTAAIVQARREGPPPDPDATDAASEYAEIKGALRTHGEPLQSAGARARRAGRRNGD